MHSQRPFSHPPVRDSVLCILQFQLNHVERLPPLLALQEHSISEKRTHEAGQHYSYMPLLVSVGEYQIVGKETPTSHHQNP
jgi:hypothetical protein